MLRNAPPELALRFAGGARSGQIIRLSDPKCSIGAADYCTLQLQAPGMAEMHCLILRGERETVVRRWADDTRLNGRTFFDAPLRPGDRLSVGPLDLEVLPPAESPPQAVASPTKERADAERRQRGRQRRRRRIRALADSLRATAREWEQLQTARAECERRQQRLQSAELALEQSRHELARAEGRLADERSEIERQQAELAERQARQAAREATLDESARQGETRREQLDAEQRRLADEQQHLASDRERLAAERQKLASDLETFAADQQRLTAACEQLDAERQQLAGERANLAAEQAGLEQQRAELTERRTALDESVRECETDREQLDAEQRLLAEERKQLDADRAQLAAECADLTEQREQLDRVRGELDAGREELAAERSRLDSEREELEAARRPQVPVADQGSDPPEPAREQAFRHEPESSSESVPADSGLPLMSEVAEPAADSTGLATAGLLPELFDAPSGGTLPDGGGDLPDNEYLARSVAASSDSGPAVPLLASDEEGSDEDLFARLREMAARQQSEPRMPETVEEPRSAEPAPPQPESPSPEIGTWRSSRPENAGQSEEDDSIENYMAGLLRRMRGENVEPPPPVEPRPMPTPAERVAPPAVAEADPPQEPWDPATMAPRHAAPEQNSDIARMRALANMSAKSAIDASRHRRLLADMLGKASVAGLALVTGGVLIHLASDVMSPAFLGGVASLVVATNWSVLAAKMYREVHDERRRLQSAERRIETEASPDDED